MKYDRVYYHEIANAGFFLSDDNPEGFERAMNAVINKPSSTFSFLYRQFLIDQQKKYQKINDGSIGGFQPGNSLSQNLEFENSKNKNHLVQKMPNRNGIEQVNSQADLESIRENEVYVKEELKVIKKRKEGINK